MTRIPMLLMLVACSSSTSPPPIGSSTKPVGMNEVTVELSSVTLADNCGDSARQPPPPAKDAKIAKADTRAMEPDAKRAPRNDDQDRDSGAGYDPCEQTSMQLALRAPAGAQPTTVRVSKVELLDETGKVVDVLTSRKPSRWADTSYVTWDEKLTANQDVATSYLLTAPNWDKLTNGKWSAHTKRFNLRVTMVVGTAERSVEKQRIQPAQIQPEVDT